MVHTARYKHKHNHYLSDALVIPRKNNGHIRVYIGPYKPSRFTNDTFIS